MNTKKQISLTLAATFVTAFCFLQPMSSGTFAANAQTEKTLTFRNDGKFRIMMMNDFQDRDVASRMSVEFLNRALDRLQPDLVVLVGDQLSNVYVGATKKKIKKAIDNICHPINDRKIPFLFTYGNHDHDQERIADKAMQASYYYDYEYCYAAKDGFDEGTYNKVIYSSDGTRPIFNIYMMDTNNRDESGKYDGVHADQVEWYKNKSDELAAMNEGAVVPSILFQHIPCKEMYNLLQYVPSATNNSAVIKYSAGPNGERFVTLDQSKMISTDNVMLEAPGSERPDKTTGQYEAWLEKGDLSFGAFFGHDHVNDFVGKTDDGVILGYNAGFGYATYGLGDERSVKIFDFDEENVSDYTFQRVKNSELKSTTPKPFNFKDIIKDLVRIVVDFLKNLL